MRCMGTIPLETPRLFLRRLNPGDAHAMYTNWSGDPEVGRFLRWRTHRSEEETHMLLSAWDALYANPDYFQWGIVEKSSGTLIGAISLYNDFAAGPLLRQWNTPKVDASQGVWCPGYSLGKAWWGQGYATEALQAVTAYWFTHCGGSWLGGCYALENFASGRVLAHAGFVLDHTGTDHKLDGTPMPCQYVYLTLSQWEDLCKSKGESIERTD